MVSIFDNGAPLPCPAQFNLASYVLCRADEISDKTALSILGAHGSQDWTFSQLKDAVLSTAKGFLDAGLKPGDRVLLRLGNTVEFPIAFLAAIAVDVNPIPMSAQLTESEVARMIALVGPKAACLDPTLSFPETVEIDHIMVDVLRNMQIKTPADFSFGAPDRLAYIVFTSGTSGTPKAVMHAHRAVWARQMMIKDWYDLHCEDRMLHAGAFNWTYTLGTGLLDPWSQGATALIPDPNLPLEDLPMLMQKYKATIFAAAPGVYRKCLSGGVFPTLPELRHGLSAGEKLSEALRKKWKIQTKTDIYEAFGMSECSTFVSSSPHKPAAQNTLGRPQTGRRVAIVAQDGSHTPVDMGKTGIIAIDRSDPGLMLGYVNADKVSADDLRSDWFLTGDLGTMSVDGSITYLGRDDDVITAGGYRVSPVEVEAQLQSHPDIFAIAVSQVEVKQDTWVIAAFYTAETAIAADTLKAFAAGHLARFKQPRIYVYCEALPTGPNGKILRRALSLPKGVSYGQA